MSVVVVVVVLVTAWRVVVPAACGGGDAAGLGASYRQNLSYPGATRPDTPVSIVMPKNKRLAPKPQKPRRNKKPGYSTVRAQAKPFGHAATTPTHAPGSANQKPGPLAAGRSLNPAVLSVNRAGF